MIHKYIIFADTKRKISLNYRHHAARETRLFVAEFKNWLDSRPAELSRHVYIYLITFNLLYCAPLRNAALTKMYSKQ